MRKLIINWTSSVKKAATVCKHGICFRGSEAAERIGDGGVQGDLLLFSVALQNYRITNNLVPLQQPASARGLGHTQKEESGTRFSKINWRGYTCKLYHPFHHPFPILIPHPSWHQRCVSILPSQAETCSGTSILPQRERRQNGADCKNAAGFWSEPLVNLTAHALGVSSSLWCA